MYRWDGEQVQLRTKAELEAERAAIPEPPSAQEQLRADVDFIAAITGGGVMSVYELAKQYYPRLWSAERIRALIAAGKLTQAQADEIINKT